MIFEVISHQEDTTIAIGKIIGEKLKAGTIITLTGDLGAGKTTMSKGIGLGLEIIEPITSPTYTIVHEYVGRLSLYHFDAYRITDCDEMYDIGFEDYLYGSGVCLIEWPQRVKELIPDNGINISINRTENENDRRITVEFFDTAHKVVCKEMIKALEEEKLNVIE